MFVGPYDYFFYDEKILKYIKKNFKIISKIFPNIDINLLSRKTRPLVIYHSQENISPSNLRYDFSITPLFNLHDKTHLRFPIWKELIDWSHVQISRPTPKFVSRYGEFYNIKELIRPLSDKFMKKKDICIFSSHLNEPRKSMYYFFSKYFNVTGYGPYFDSSIKDHNSNPFSKKSILKEYAFNLCPENSMYPGYYTEKVPEAFLSNSLPLAWADPNIKLDFNENSMINLFNYFHDDYSEIANLLKDENFLKKFTYEPLLLTEPSLDLEYKFIEKILKLVN